MLIVPHGLKGVEKTFGKFNYRSLSKGGVLVDRDWESKNIVNVEDVCGTGLFLQINLQLVELFKDALSAAMSACPMYEIRTMSGYDQRRQFNDESLPLSLHSWGAAVDINWDKNKTITVDAPWRLKNAFRDIPTEFVDAFRRRGWVWGGDFANVKDFMHFQYATGC